MTEAQLRKGKELQTKMSHVLNELYEWKKTTGFKEKNVELKGSYIEININDYISFKEIQQNAINKLEAELSALQKEFDEL